MKILLDTSAMIDYISGNTKVRDILESSDGINISPISFYEVLIGIEDKQGRTAIRNTFSEFPSLPFTTHDSMRAASIHLYLREKGRIINPLDILIAAQALEHGFTLLTKDKDFDRISEGFDLTVLKIK